MRIALIGRNGCGKSTLLKMLQGLFVPSEGQIHIPEDVSVGYVPQVIESFETLSGGQRLNEVLSVALAKKPNILLLDEPTNHLDEKNRRSFLRFLQRFPGTFITVTHDRELLQTGINTLWHIHDGKIAVFSGNYEDYIQETTHKRSSLEQQLTHLNRQKKDAHQTLMQEQARSKNSRLQGEKRIAQRKWPTIVSSAKARRAEETSGRKKSHINAMKEGLMEKLQGLALPDEIVPKFLLRADEQLSSKVILSIRDGACGYDVPLLHNLFLSLTGVGRLAITGGNGSGKTTLVRAILNDVCVVRSGEWVLPTQEDIGYLDQHYATLAPHQSVLETIQTCVPTWPPGEVRRHLNDFLFRKNEEVTALTSTLSGGEKARLCLAQIAAKTPRLLILDEITNNLDLETRTHVIQILQGYPGAVIAISHDPGFLKEIGIHNFYEIKKEKK